jgi:hypothetical protein
MSGRGDDDRLNRLLDLHDVPRLREGLAEDIMARLPQDVLSRPSAKPRASLWVRLFGGLELRAAAAGFAALAIGVWIGLSGDVLSEPPLAEEDFIIALGGLESGFGDLAYLEDGS